MKRRPRGTGTIRQREDGKFRALFAFVAGQPREDIEGSPFETYEAAETALDALLAGLQALGATRGGITLRRLGERALDHREAEGYRGIENDRDLWNGRVAKWELASAPACSISKGDVRAWLAGLRSLKDPERGLAAQTKRNALNLLRFVFAYGIDTERVSENPCLGVRVKDGGRTLEGSTFLSLAEATKLVTVAADPGVGLAIGTGMRSGELRSLLWKDVRKDRIIVRYGAPGLPPKNGKIREIPILPLARQALDRLPRTASMVLPNTEGGFRQKGKVFDRASWKAWLKAAKLKRRVRPHDLRHTCATLLLTGEMGGRPWTYEEVKELLGHSSVTVTERYARATGTLAQKAAREMHKGQIGAKLDPTIVAQAVEMIGSHLRDLNSRPTVYETQVIVSDSEWMATLWRLSGSYAKAVAAGSDFAHAKGLALADAVFDFVKAQRSYAPTEKRPLQAVQR